MIYKTLSSKIIDGIIICIDDIGSIDSQISNINASNVKGAALIADNHKFFEVGGPLCPCVVISSKEAPLVLNYAKTNIRPNATIIFQHTIVGDKACTNCGKLRFKRSVAELSKHIEAGYYGTGVDSFRCLDARNPSGTI